MNFELEIFYSYNKKQTFFAQNFKVVEVIQISYEKFSDRLVKRRTFFLDFYWFFKKLNNIKKKQTMCHLCWITGCVFETECAMCLFTTPLLALSAGAIEYTDCFSAEGWDLHQHQMSWYDTKQIDGELPVML